MHQRSTTSRTRRWLGGVLSLLLVTGCFPSPTKAPTGSKPSGLQVAGKPIASPSASDAPTDVPTGNPSVPTLPIAVTAPIISHNGGNVIQGTVMAPATIISHNGGNIISHNGGNVVSNGGGNIISHNGGNIVGNNGGNFKISQVPLAYATVRLKDAAGNPVKDDQGVELVTKTDENGAYKFPVDVTGRNLVVHAEVPGQKADLVALLPKDGLVAGTSMSVDMASTLTLSYILELYVKGDLATFEKLPRDLESKARAQTETAIVKGAIALPETLEREELISTVSQVIQADDLVKTSFDEIRRILVVAGIQNEGDGLPATQIPVSTVDGVVADSNGEFYVFSRSRHTLWKIGADGKARTLVPQGKWGYPDRINDKLDDHSISGLAFDLDGSLIIADTDYHRIVRITKDNRVVEIAGTGVAGFAGDGGHAKDALINEPTGLVVRSDGAILFCDSRNRRIRKIGISKNIETYSGGSGEALTTISVAEIGKVTYKEPQGLLLSNSDTLFVADYGSNSVARIEKDKVTRIGTDGQFIGPISFAQYNGKLFLLCGNQGGLFDITSASDIRLLESHKISDGSYALTGFSNKKLLAPISTGVVVNDFGRLYLWDGTNVLKHIFGELPYLSNNIGNLALAYGLCIRGNDVFVSDLAQHKIFKVTSDGEFIHYVGNGISDQYISESSDLIDFPLPFPKSISVAQDGGILIASIGNFPVIKKISTTGEIRTIIGDGKINYTTVPNGPAATVSLANPHDVVELPSGEIIFVEPDENRIFRVSGNGEVGQLFAGEDLKYPSSLVLDRTGKLNYVELQGSRVVILDQGIRKTRIDYSSLSPEIESGSLIKAIAFDDRDNLYLATKDQVLRVTPDGRKNLIAGVNGMVLNGSTKDTGLFDVERLGVTVSGELYILEKSQLKKVELSTLSGL